MSAEQDFTVSPEAAELLAALFRAKWETRGRDFGNGRFVRNVLEGVVQNHAMRVQREGLSDRSELSQLRAEDIPSLDALARNFLPPPQAHGVKENI